VFNCLVFKDQVRCFAISAATLDILPRSFNFVNMFFKFFYKYFSLTLSCFCPWIPIISSNYCLSTAFSIFLNKLDYLSAGASEEEFFIYTHSPHDRRFFINKISYTVHLKHLNCLINILTA